jgi:hypothetical protein
MGVFWAILEVIDRVLPAGVRILLARMYLLDNGTVGCNASAAQLAEYTGLTTRTVDEYRRRLDCHGLAFRVHGTHGWHVVLPTPMAADRATDKEIRDYARWIEAATIPLPESGNNAPPIEGSSEPGSEESPTRTGGTPNAKGEIRHRESPTHVGESVRRLTGAIPPGAAPRLMSTHETHEDTLMSSSRSRTKDTDEEHRHSNSVTPPLPPKGDSRSTVEGPPPAAIASQDASQRRHLEKTQDASGAGAPAQNGNDLEEYLDGKRLRLRPRAPSGTAPQVVGQGADLAPADGGESRTGIELPAWRAEEQGDVPPGDEPVDEEPEDP